MLVKELCQRCHDLNRVRKWSRQPAKDRDWNRGRIACIALFTLGHLKYIKTSGLPPKRCHFLVEQTINSSCE